MRNDVSLDVAKAFDPSLLERIDLIGPDITAKTIALLATIKEHQKNSDAIARSISSIINKTQQLYSWNIVINGHGSPISESEIPLSERSSTDEDEGVIANMPPAQLAKLLRTFTLLPINIVLLGTCYGGGYNAALMEQQLEILERIYATIAEKTSLFNKILELEKKSKTGPLSKDEQDILDAHTLITTHSEKSNEKAVDIFKAIQLIKKIQAHKNYRPFALVSLAAFDLTTTMGRPGQWLQKFEILFDQTPLPSEAKIKESIKEILWRGCKYSPIILMPTSEKFELLTKPECLERLINTIVADRQTSTRSINFILATQDKPAEQLALFKKIDTEGPNYTLKIQLIPSYLALILKEAQANPDRAKELINNADYNSTPPLILAIENGATDIIDKLLTFKDLDINVKYAFDKKTPLQIAAHNGDVATFDKLLAKNADIAATDSNNKTTLMFAAQGGNPEIVDKLLAKKVDVTVVDNNKKTALMYAIEKGNPAIVDKLLISGADVNMPDKDGKTPLMYAIKENDLTIVDAILAKKPNLDAQAHDYSGGTALTNAIGKNSEIALKLLDLGADVNMPDKDGKTPLMYAIEKGDPAIVDKILDKKPNLDAQAQGYSGETALTKAIEKNPEIALKFLDLGANVDIPNTEGKTPLILAVERKNVTLIDKILTKKPNLNVQNVGAGGYGRTALIYAIETTPEIAITLLNAGTDIDIPDKNKETPLMYAIKKDDPTIVDAILAKKPNLNAQGYAKKTALTKAIEKNPKIALKLLDAGAAVDIPDELDKTPLMYAIEKDDPTIIDAILAKKPNLNTQDYYGETALTKAIEQNPEIALKLLDAGAAIDIPDKRGKTPLMYAAAKNDATLVNRLLAKKVDVTLTDDYKRTALMYALEKGDPAIVDKLLSAGADATIPNEEGKTPLMYAIEKGDPAIVDKILDKKPNLDAQAQGYSGETALTKAIEKNPEIALKLLDLGANVDIPNTEGKTPLIFAVEQNNATLIDKILAKKPKLDAQAQGYAGGTALTKAIEKNPEIALKLLDLGANVDIPNTENKTPLILAVEQNNVTLIDKILAKKPKLDEKAHDYKETTALIEAINKSPESALKLLDAGATVDIPDKYGTPLMYAVSKNNPVIIEKLLNKGAIVNDTVLKFATDANASADIMKLLQDAAVRQVAQ